MSTGKFDSKITAAARDRNKVILNHYDDQVLEIETKYLIQMAHLTVPANVWRYIEKAVTESHANLVMLDLEDSVPDGDAGLLDEARTNVIRAFDELNWGGKLRFFRPRGLQLDPAHEDIAVIVEAAGNRIDGLVYPKVEGPDEVRSLDATLLALEKKTGLAEGAIKIELLIESARAEERAFEIAGSSRRLVGLVFGSYDYWASLGLPAHLYRFDHPLLNQARGRIVKASAAVGVPAIAEMTTNYPTKDKTEDERRAALDEFRRDALVARDFGFVGKWTGIPDQSELAVALFQIQTDQIHQAIEETRAYLEAERLGRGAIMIAGKMADRATDRINRRTLRAARALGLLDEQLARDLGIT